VIIRRDFRMTDDGDLALGSERRDADGNILYVNRFGEESTDPSQGQTIRDMTVASQKNAIKQVLRNRLMTDAPDWYHYPDMGGNMSDLIGEPNTRATAQLGVDNIMKMITYDNYLSPSDVSVKPIPVDTTTILFYIELQKGNDVNMDYPVLFDLDTGLMSEYELPKEDK
jgi:hypothetical protein